MTECREGERLLFYGEFQRKSRELMPEPIPEQIEYMHGKPQYIAEPHELSSELMQQAEPTTESLEPLEQAFETETVEHVPEPPRFVPGNYGYFDLPVYRMAPVVYVPIYPAYLPFFPVY